MSSGEIAIDLLILRSAYDPNSIVQPQSQENAVYSCITDFVEQTSHIPNTIESIEYTIQNITKCIVSPNISQKYYSMNAI